MDFHTIISRLFSGSALKVLSLCCSVGASLFLMPLLIHSLGDRDYSLWVLIGTFTGYYGFADLGLGIATGRYVSRALGRNDLHEINVIANTSLFIYLCLGVIVFAISTCVAFATPLFVSNPDEAYTLTKTLIVAGLTVSLQFPVRVAGGILHSYVRHDLITYATLIEMFLKLSLIYYFINEGYGLFALAVIMLGVGVIEYTLELVFMKHTCPSLRFSRKYVDLSRIKDMFSYAIIAITGNLTKSMQLKIVPVMVVSIAGVNSVVIFSIAQRLLEYFQQLIESIMDMFHTVFSQIEGQDNMDAVRKGFKYTSIITISISLYVAVSLLMYGEQFISVWLGDAYTQAFFILGILTIPIMVSLMQAPCNQVLMGISRHSYCATIHTIQLILVLACGFGLGWMYGMYGIASGVALGIIIPEMFLPAVMCKVLKTKFSELYGDMIVPFTLKCVLIMICVLLVRDYVESSYLNLILWNIGQAMIICPLLFLILPKELRTIIIGTLFKNRSIVTVAS